MTFRTGFVLIILAQLICCNLFFSLNSISANYAHFEAYNKQESNWQKHNTQAGHYTKINAASNASAANQIGTGAAIAHLAAFNQLTAWERKNNFFDDRTNAEAIQYFQSLIYQLENCVLSDKVYALLSLLSIDMIDLDLKIREDLEMQRDYYIAQYFDKYGNLSYRALHESKLINFLQYIKQKFLGELWPQEPCTLKVALGNDSNEALSNLIRECRQGNFQEAQKYLQGYPKNTLMKEVFQLEQKLWQERNSNKLVTNHQMSEIQSLSNSKSSFDCEELQQFYRNALVSNELSIEDLHWFQGRIDAIELCKKTESVSFRQSYAISIEGKLVLAECNISCDKIEYCFGTALQQEAHREIVDIVNQSGKLYTLNSDENIIHAVVQVAGSAAEFNTKGNVPRAWSLASICREALNYVDAIAEGFVDGIAANASYMAEHPIKFGMRSLIGTAYTIADLTYEYGGFVAEKLANMDYKDLSYQNVKDYIDRAAQLITEQCKDLTGPEIVKSSFAFVTDVCIQGKCSKALNGLCSSISKNLDRIARKLSVRVSEPLGIMHIADGMPIRTSAQRKLFVSSGEAIDATRNVPIDKFIPAGHANDVIKSISIPKDSQGIIKKFDITEKMIEHTCTQEHLEKGLKYLAKTNEEILDKIAEKIMQANAIGILKNNSNHIECIINGKRVIIRCNIHNESVRMIDAFLARGNDRIIGNGICLYD